ncbi:hypothetical protein GPECTOR_61g853 [Gonium pectorale]|uniref:RAP domain-containing protein n=1 Tax=Gonium pectorale TaxID=33097 RepID=A0A150G6D3_GONPE|nr:hypothetical protein GPECTOR_61g853 [Gonium pectorale]|eukprot:KXZ44900.1 hypothetical protein GPECTOR_61g853 [Gonium pectorale]
MELVDGLASHFVALLPAATLREVSGVLRSLAKLGRPVPHALLRSLASDEQRARLLLRGASPQALAQVLWALGTWRERGPAPLLPALLAACDAALPSFTSHDVSQVLWALARLAHHPGPHLLRRLASVAARLAPGMAPQGLAMCAWACRRLRLAHGAFLHASAASFLRQLPAATPTDMALMAASLAGLQYRSPALLRALAERCCAPAGRPGAGAGAEQAGDRRGRWQHGVAAAATAAGGYVPACAGWSVHSRQQLLWAFATLGFRHGRAVRALLQLAPGSAWAWEWEPGGSDDAPAGGAAGARRGGGGAGAEGGAAGSVPLGASTLIWCLGKLLGARAAPPEMQAAMAAADALWVDRRAARLSHVAAAVWGLQRMGCSDERLLRLACQRLMEALARCRPESGERERRGEGRQGAGGCEADVAAISPGSASQSPNPQLGDDGRDSAEGARSAGVDDGTAPADVTATVDGGGGGGELPAGDLDAAVMVLACLGRSGAADGGVLDAFAAAAPRLMRRLSARQLPLVCCAYVQLGRSDAEVLGGTAQLLLASSGGGRKGESGGGGVDSDGGGGGLLARLPRNGLALTLWALASSGYASPQLMQKVVPRVMRLFPPPAPSQPPAPPAMPSLHREAASAGGAATAAAAAWSPSPEAAGDGMDAGWGVQAVDKFPASPANGLASRARGGGGGGASDGEDADGALWSDGRDNEDYLGGGFADFEVGVAGDGRKTATAQQHHRHHRSGAGDDDLDEDEEDGELDDDADGGGEPNSAPAARWAALLLWSFAAADCYSPLLYDCLLSAALARLPRLGAGRAALLLWACAVAGHHRRGALEALGGAMQRSWLRELPPASFTQVVWSMAHLTGGVCLSWRGPSAARLAALAPELSRHQAAVLLWSLAVQQLLLLGDSSGGSAGGDGEDGSGGADGAGEGKTTTADVDLDAGSAVAAAARRLGYRPRVLRTSAALPLALPVAVELPNARPGPAVLLLAERSDFASNEAGQPLGPLFTNVQLLQERGWRVAVVLAPQFASLRLPGRRAAFLQALLAAAGVRGPAAAAALKGPPGAPPSGRPPTGG